MIRQTVLNRGTVSLALMVSLMQSQAILADGPLLLGNPSDYDLNGAQAAYDSASTVLRQAQSDLSITQSRVDQLSQTQAIELGRFDAISASRNTVGQNLQDAINRLQDLTNRLAPAIDAQNQLQSLLSSLARAQAIEQVNRDNLQSQYNQASQGFAPLDQRARDKEAQAAQLVQLAAQKSQLAANLQNQLNEGVTALPGLEQSKNELAAQITSLTPQVNSLKNQVSSNQAAVQTQSATVEQIESSIDQMNTKLKHLQEKYDYEVRIKNPNAPNVKAEIQTLKSARDGAKGQETAMRQSLAESKAALSSALNSLNQVTRSLANAQEQFPHIDARFRNLRDSLPGIRTALASTQNETIQAQAQANRASEEARDARQRANQIGSTLDRITGPLSASNQKLADLQLQINGGSAELSRIQGFIADARFQIPQLQAAASNLDRDLRNLRSRYDSQSRLLSVIQSDLQNAVLARDQLSRIVQTNQRNSDLSQSRLTRVLYFSSNAVPKYSGSIVMNTNGSGSLTPGSSLTLSTTVDNLGMVSQTQDIHLMLGNASTGLVIDQADMIITALPGRTRSMLSGLGAFHVTSDTLPGSTLSLDVSLVQGNQVIGSETLTLSVEGILSIGSVQGVSSATADVENFVDLTITNGSPRTSGSDLSVQLVSPDGLATIMTGSAILGQMAPGETKTVRLSYTFSQSILSSSSSLQLSAQLVLAGTVISGGNSITVTLPPAQQ